MGVSSEHACESYVEFSSSPEALGVISGAVYMITVFLFIPVPFLPAIIGPEGPFEHHEV